MASRPMLWVIMASISILPSMYQSTIFGTSVRPLAPPKAVPRQTRPVTSWKGRVEISAPAGATPMMTDSPQPLCAHSRAWRRYDVADLIRRGHRCPPLLVDQGGEDEFLPELLPEALREACAAAGQPLTLNMREGYDHSYWFVQSFMADHFAHHAATLSA